MDPVMTAIQFHEQFTLSASGLAGLAELDPLIDGVLFLDTVNSMIGRPGEGKTFVALDMAASVATNRPWHGRTVKPGKALYVAAEGVRGLAKRLDAWRQHYGLSIEDLGDIQFYRIPVQVTGSLWSSFTEFCLVSGFSFIIIDTVARVSVGLEENSAKDMGLFVEQVEELRRVTGACVLLIHHIGRSGSRGRGSSAVDGAVSTEITVDLNRGTNVIKVSNTKQKDVGEFEPFLLTPVTVGDSLVLTSEAATNPLEEKMWYIVNHLYPQLLSRSELAAQLISEGFPKTTIYRTIDRTTGLVLKKLNSKP